MSEKTTNTDDVLDVIHKDPEKESNPNTAIDIMVKRMSLILNDEISAFSELEKLKEENLSLRRMVIEAWDAGVLAVYNSDWARLMITYGKGDANYILGLNPYKIKDEEHKG